MILLKEALCQAYPGRCCREEPGEGVRSDPEFKDGPIICQGQFSKVLDLGTLLLLFMWLVPISTYSVRN